MALPSSAWVPTTMSTLPSARPFLHSASSRGGHQPRGLRDLDRKAAEALGEGLEVLAREQRRRHHHRDLLAVHRRDEGRAQRHLGLAEADVAADQPVHRPAGGEIVERRVDGGLLVVGLLVGEAGAELVIGARRRRSSLRRLAQLPLGRDLDQLAGDLADAALHPRLARLPGAAAEPVELDRRSPPSRSATAARCSRPAGTAWRRRRSGFRGSRAARRPPRSPAGRRSGRCRDRRARRDRRPRGWSPRR